MNVFHASEKLNTEGVEKSLILIFVDIQASFPLEILA